MQASWKTVRVGHAMGAFGVTFGALVAAGFAGMRHLPALAFARQEVPSLAFADSGWYPVLFRGGSQLDHTLIWNGIGGVETNARRADVVFVGSSQMQFAVPPHELRAFTRRTGVTAFTLALPFSERHTFALRLIEKLDVRPRLVVANVPGFFQAGESVQALRAVRAGHWAGVTTFWEERLAVAVWPAASRVLPSFFTRRPEQTLLRSSTDGGWLPVRWPDRHVRVRPGSVPIDLRSARRFRDALAARGTALALICVPAYTGTCTPDELQRAAAALGVPAIVPHVDGPLWTSDGAHLCPVSGKRFGRALLRDVGDLAVVRSVARRPRPASAGGPADAR